MKQMNEIQNVRKEFFNQATATPWIYQKCSLRGIFILKACLSDIRGDSQKILEKEIIRENKRLHKQIEAMKDEIGKETRADLGEENEKELVSSDSDLEDVTGKDKVEVTAVENVVEESKLPKPEEI